MKKIISLLLALVFIAAPLAACSDNTEETDNSQNSKYNADSIVLSTENFSYTRAEYSIAFYQYCNEIFSDQETVDFYNVDSNLSLKNQVYYDDVTWFDYFSDMAVDLRGRKGSGHRAFQG